MGFEGAPLEQENTEITATSSAESYWSELSPDGQKNITAEEISEILSESADIKEVESKLNDLEGERIKTAARDGSTGYQAGFGIRRAMEGNRGIRAYFENKGK